MANRSVRTKKNILSGFINKLITLFLPFLIRTIIIKKLGAEYLGLSSLFTSILQVLNMAELGFSSAIVFSLYKPMAEKNTAEICALLHYYKNIYKVVGIVISVVGCILIPFLPNLINGSYPSDIDLYVLYIIFLANTSVSYFAFAYKSVLLTADQHQNIISNIDTILCILRYGIQIAMLIIISNYYAYIIWNLIFTVANNIIVAVITNNKYPEYICKGEISKDKKNEITKQIKGLAIGKVSLVARNSLDSIVLSMFCGLVDVAIYSNYYYIYSAIGGFLSVIVAALTGSVGNSIATESVEKNYYDCQRFSFFFSGIISVCTVCLFGLYQPFMKIWVGEQYVASGTVMILFCVYFYISQIGQIRGIYASAAGIWWEFRWAELCEMLGNLLLNFLLGYFWGMKGILIATIITVTIFSLIWITDVTFKEYFKRNTVDYWKDNAIYFVMTDVAIFIVWHLFKYVRTTGIVDLFVRLLICVATGIGVYGILIMISGKYRRYFISVVENTLKR